MYKLLLLVIVFFPCILQLAAGLVIKFDTKWEIYWGSFSSPAHEIKCNYRCIQPTRNLGILVILLRNYKNSCSENEIYKFKCLAVEIEKFESQAPKQKYILVRSWSYSVSTTIKLRSPKMGRTDSQPEVQNIYLGVNIIFMPYQSFCVIKSNNLYFCGNCGEKKNFKIPKGAVFIILQSKVVIHSICVSQ